MKKFALMIAAIATISIAAPSSNADAQTVVIKRGGHHHGGYHPGTGPAPRCTTTIAAIGRGRGHGSKVIVIKKRHHHY